MEIMRYNADTDRLSPVFADFQALRVVPEWVPEYFPVKRSADIEHSDERGRWEAINLTPSARVALRGAGFAWDARNQVWYAPTDDIALAGMEAINVE